MLNINQIKTKIASISLVAVMGLTIFSSQPQVNAAWSDTYDSQINVLKDKVNTLNSQMNDYKAKVSAVQDRKATLSAEVAAIQDEISKTDALLTETRNTITEVQKQVDTKQAEVDKLATQMGDIYRSIQKNTPGSFVEIMLSSQTLDQAITKLNSLSSLENELDRMRTEAKTKVDELKKTKELLQQTEDTYKQSQALNATKKSQLDYLLEQTKGEEAQYQTLIANTQNQQSEFQGQIKSIDAAKQAEADRIAKEEAAKAAAIQANNGGGSGVIGTLVSGVTGVYAGSDEGGGDGNKCGRINEGNYANIPDGYFARPTYGAITNGFGCVPWAVGGYRHDGVDIANGKGTPIYAAATGVVVTDNCGLGICVLIKHQVNGRTLYTVYGHLSGEVVSRGQAVQQGDVIGYMGATGYATGVHLHFAIYDESFGITGVPNCNPAYGYTATKCLNPLGGPTRIR